MALRPAARLDGERAAELAEALGNRVRTFRIQRSESQADLARALGTATEAISRLERGQVVPSLGRLARIADLFDVPLERLIVSEHKDDQNELVARFADLVRNSTPDELEALKDIVRGLARLRGSDDDKEDENQMREPEDNQAGEQSQGVPWPDGPTSVEQVREVLRSGALSRPPTNDTDSSDE